MLYSGKNIRKALPYSYICSASQFPFLRCMLFASKAFSTKTEIGFFRFCNKNGLFRRKDERTRGTTLLYVYHTKDKHLSAPITGSRRCAISCTKLMRRNLQILCCNPFSNRTALCGCNQLCPYTQSSLFLMCDSRGFYHRFLGKSRAAPSSAIRTIICTAFSMEGTGTNS